jgi:hypothetical protein
MTTGLATNLGMVRANEERSDPRSGGEPKATHLPEEVQRFGGLPAEQRLLLLHVHELLADIPFGTVVLVLQDGKVIQIETSEKIRLR